MARYDIYAKAGGRDDPAFIRSVTNRTHAIEVADDLVEREGWWSAHVATERRLVTYSRNSEPFMCEVNGWELPLHKGRAFLNFVSYDGENTLYFRTDDEMNEVKARVERAGDELRWALTIRDVDGYIHEEVTGWRATDEPPF